MLAVKVSYKRPYMLTVGSNSTPISPQQWNVIWCAMLNPVATHDMLMDALWPDPDRMPDCWSGVLRVLICNLNKILKGTGVKIRCISRRGYLLEMKEGTT